ncbi:GGDEF domain-containing protein [Planococcus shenhongbingii]|uniref:GGDEF domain-containing protein n=1 Tax=Planococcus shenhongbingii TaxID=3058398 RepID=UPI0026076816|nr:GGDEF domain-containing protein [Planococcus sp. N016]WKA58231.1 GGDEF domain-containing protein [Planococcus sp. N016]
MEEQLNLAPFCYLVIEESYRIVEMNVAMRELIGTERPMPTHVHELLTIASRVYFQTYFMPSITLHGKVNEMFLTIKGAEGPVPVLMNTAKRNGHFECAMIPMTERGEYEKELLLAKRNAEKIHQETAEAYAKLQSLMEKVEQKQRELEELNTSLQQMTTTDPLTGLKNRRYLEEILSEMTGQAEAGRPLSLLVIDIDFFKRINDTYGHQMGDAVLQELSWKLLSETDGQGIVSRMGGEEFVILLPDASKDEAHSFAEQLRRQIEHAEWLHVPVTVSIGVAVFENEDNADSLFARADEALYISKNSGRNRVTVT